MSEESKLSKSEQHLTFENPMHQETVAKVYNKWFGPDAVVHGNEGQAVQACYAHGESMRAEAQAVSPEGRMFDVQSQNLSDRMYHKYGTPYRTEAFAGGKNEEATRAARPNLSDRKYGKK